MEIAIALVAAAAVIGFIVYRLNRKVEATRPTVRRETPRNLDRNEQ